MIGSGLSYRRRLRRDVVRWREAGWVSEDGGRAILADADTRGMGLAPALGMLGAVLIAFAAMSFVAANWEAMPKLLRLSLLTGALWGAYGAAGALFNRGQEALGHAAVVLACGLFGADIMLIAQMYHMEGNPPDAVLTWAAGSLVAGVALRSGPALALAMALVALWSGWEAVLTQRVHWPFLIGWAAVAAGFALCRWRPGLHLAGLALAGFVICLGFQIGDGHQHWIALVLGLGAAGAAYAVGDLRPDWHDEATAVLGYALATVFAGLFIMQFIEHRVGPDSLVVLALLALALTLGMVVWGTRVGNRGLLWLGYLGFTVEILALYFKTIGSLIGSSLFFLLTWLVVMGLAWLAWKLHARNPAAQEAH